MSRVSLPRLILRWVLALIIATPLAYLLAALLYPVLDALLGGPACRLPSFWDCLEQDMIAGLYLFVPWATFPGIPVLTVLLYFVLFRRK